MECIISTMEDTYILSLDHSLISGLYTGTMFTLDKEKGSVVPTIAPSGGVDWSKFGAKKIIDDGWRVNRDYAWK